MNKFERMQTIIQLKKEKERLLEKASLVDEEIENKQKDCSHIYVDLGSYGKYSISQNECLCLICGKVKENKYYYETLEKRIHAEKYLPGFNLTDETQCMKKFERVQEIALTILREYPSLSDKELVDRLNSLIEKSIASKESNKVIKLMPVTEMPE